MLQFVRRPHATWVVEGIVALACGLLAGLAVSGLQIPLVQTTGFATIGALVVVVALFVVGLRRPLVPFAALLLVFPAGDLARKLGNGSRELLFAKDVVLVVGLAALSVHTSLWRDVTASCRRWLQPLACFAAWYVVVAGTNSFINVNHQLPFIGIRNFFEFVPLLGVGWYIASDRTRLSTAIKFFCVVACTVTVVGIAQAVQGPSFLASRASDELFTHLNLVRRAVGQSTTVFQPSGVFVEPSRFANWAFITFVLGLSLFPLRGRSPARFAVVAVGAIGVFAASNRTLMIASVAVVVAVVVWHLRQSSARALRLVLVVTVATLILGTGARVFFPAQFQGRVDFITGSLDLRVEDSELSQRAPGYVESTISAARRAGVVGKGAGTQGLGRQYVGDGPQVEQLAEGGFATVVGEAGIVGLSLWVLWTTLAIAMCFRVVGRVKEPLQACLVPVVFGLGAQMFVIMWIAIGAIQDYVFNSWLFVILGAIAALGAAGMPDSEDQVGIVSSATSGPNLISVEIRE